ncbi:ABC transporter substrate-binding protein [Poseidonocella sp. HB161398]|uniref:ABC transporter substrate-binding protein n=1 Tax=Poseidonocella sp. HB161398 TaxID=2320855 RepID=UPI0011093BC2|nr:ABC transporter substrate-binding protein [Poseidonocella sp. HB161398]
MTGTSSPRARLRRLLLSAPLLAAAAAAAAAETPGTVKVGVVLPLSGANAKFGATSRNGIELALQGINAAGGIKGLGGARLELVYADVPTPNAAGSAVQRLVMQDKVVGVIGSFVSSITIAGSEVTERAGVPWITHAFSDKITGRGYRNIFQITPPGSVFGETQFGFALELLDRPEAPVEKVAILYEDTAYGTSQAAGLRAAAEAAGVEVVVDEAYPLGITDVTPLVNRLRAAAPDLVFPVSYLNDSLMIIRGMRQQGLDMPTIGGAAGYVIPDFQRGLGDLAEGVFSISPTNYDLVPEEAEAYFDTYGEFMTQEAQSYAAALELMADAISDAGTTDPQAIRDEIAANDYCEGFVAGMPGGCPEFDGTGLNVKAVPVFVQWQGEDLVTVYPPELARGPAELGE